MARGFSIQDIACITLEGSIQAEVSPPSNQKKDKSKMLPGLNWFDKQKEKRRREHLKLEAEKQLKKIGEAQRAAHRESAGSVASTSTKNNNNSNNNNNNNNNSGVLALVNPNKSLADSSSCSSSEGISSGVDFVANRSLQSTEDRQQHYLTHSSNSFGNSEVSKSGEGASGMLSLSDIDGICADEAAIRNSMMVREESTKSSHPNIDDDDDDDDNDNDDESNDKIDDTIGPVRVTKMDGDEASPYILTQTQMNEIAKHVLPETITYCRWRRLYSLGRDGDSFDGCLRIIGTSKRTLMVVRTTKGDVFGGYADAPWHSRHDSSTAKFYGSASSCLYSFSSTKTRNSSSPLSSPINVYRWTGKNRYIQVCDVSNKMLAFGGGGDKGAFGLCLQEDFERGTTGHCETFDNDPLCSSNERTFFDIVDVEFWEFLTGVF